MVTQKDIARKLGISQSAVACAMNPALHRYVSLRNREHILATAEKLGYAPHQSARRLIQTRFKRRITPFDQVGLIYLARGIQHLDPVCLALIFGIEHELAKAQASFVFVNVGPAGGWEKVERMTRTSGVDAWLVYGDVNDDVAARLKRGRLPFVIIGDHRCTKPVSCVRVDNAGVGRLAAEHLAAHGHRRVAFFAGDMDFVYTQEMLAGFRAAWAGLGLRADDLSILPPRMWGGSDGRPIREWLRDVQPKPTAIFASERDLGDDVYRIVRDSPAGGGQGVTVLGCEMGELGPKHREYSQVELPVTDVGRRAAVLLHEIVQAPRTPASEVKLPATVVDRGTYIAAQS